MATAFDDFLYDPGQGTPGDRVTSFPVSVDNGTKTWQLEDDVRPDTNSGRGFFRPPDGRGIMLVVQGERTELNFVGPGYDGVVENGDEHHYGAIGRFLRPSNPGTWNLAGQIRWSNPGGHPCWGLEILKERAFCDVRAYDTPAIGQAARTYPDKPGVLFPFDTEIALYAHIKIMRAGGGIVHVAYAPAAYDSATGRYTVTGAWTDLVNLPNVAVGYNTVNGSAGFYKLFFSHYSADYSKRTTYLRRHAGALTKGRLDELMGWNVAAPPAPVVDTTAPVSALTVGYVAGESVIDFSCVASDNIGVTKVEFALDGQPLATEVNAPYERTDHPLAGPLATGDHVVEATAFDATGNIDTDSVTITVGAPPPPPPPNEDPKIGLARAKFNAIKDVADAGLLEMGDPPVA